MTREEAFKFGFLLRCAEEGLSKAATDARAQRGCDLLATQTKSANSFLEAIKAYALDPLRWGGEKALNLAMYGIPLSMAVGGAAGWGLANATQPDADVEQAKAQEMLDTYQMLAEQARQNAERRRAYRPAAPSGPKLLR